MRFPTTLVLAATSALAGAPVAAESTRTVRVELQGDPSRPFAVENLAGTMTVRGTAGSKVVATATVHAESDALAGSVRFEQVPDDKGVPTLRVRYPEGERDFRYPQAQGRGDTRYDGRRVRVSPHSGTLLWADVVVEVPSSELDGTFRTHYGDASGEGLTGRVRLDTGSGAITAKRLSGDCTADTGSGDVVASDLNGSFKCDTGSGDCDVRAFEGELLDLDTGSGTIRVADARGRRFHADTGSGPVRLERGDFVDLAVDTGSGEVELEAGGTRLSQIDVDTGSGDVSLRLDDGVGFEALADQGSGDLDCRSAGAEPITRRKEVVGCRRGDGRVRIRVDTGSGGLTIASSK